MKPTIGFIGVGNMGGAMSRHLLKAGYPLVVHDVREAAMEALKQAGADAATSPLDLARRSGVVITMLPSSTEVEAVALGPGGLLEGLGAGGILIDMTSAHPSSTRMVHDRLAAKGLRMMDAPVSGGVKGAREANLSIMVGGDEKDYEEVRPVLEVMGKNIYYVGKIGAGHAMKALNNLCSACSMAITSEAMVVAARLGLDPVKAIEILNTSSGSSWSTQYKFPNFVLTRRFNSGFDIGLMNKDVDIALNLGRELRVPMFVGSMVQQLYRLAVAEGRGSECHTAIVKFVEEWGGVQVTGPKDG